eukprot:TRINITY_DN4896_c0_g1_i1.p1 TRINITY_DN4896_c0_g1~~TRINITY_DN4896_c0_g1_i1.p1  ORF type:complete len:197 (+),score=33.40 TRINITY_DN4896_c0_g1_i1:418-1008(+)
MCTQEISNGDFLDFLLVFSLPINVPDNNSITPLMQAVTCQNIVMIEALIKKRCDPNISSNNCLNALDMALSVGNEEILGILLDYISNYDEVISNIRNSTSIEKKQNPVNEDDFHNQIKTRLTELREELARKVEQANLLEGHLYCISCNSSYINTVILECGHTVLCSDCSEAYQSNKKCPMCDSKITQILQTYTMKE